MATIIWAGVALSDGISPPRTRSGVCVEGTTVLAAGPLDQLAARFPTAERVGNESWLLLPGFTNAHDHGRGLGALPLGVPDDLLEIWLPGLYSQPGVDPFLLSVWEGLQLLHSGVTLTAHSHNPQDWRNLEAEAAAVLCGYAEAGVRVAFHPPLVDQNPLVYADRDDFLAGLPTTLHDAAQQFLGRVPLTHGEYFDLCRRLHATYHDPAEHRVHIQVSPAGGQWCSDALIVAAVDFARRHGTRVQMHMLETRYQAAYARRTWGASFIRHLHDIGALGPWLTLAHMVWTEPDDLPLLQASGACIAHNPGSNLRLRSGIAPLPDYLAHGIPSGVGMDGQTLDDDQDYLRELRLAWTLANSPGAVSPTIHAGQVLNMGFAAGAHVTLGTSAGLGRLVPGAPADLVLLDWDAVCMPWVSPRTPVADTLLRRAGRRHVRHVMVNGQWALRDGESTHVDERAVAAQIRAALDAQPADALAARARAADALAPYLRRFYAAWEDVSAPRDWGRGR